MKCNGDCADMFEQKKKFFRGTERQEGMAFGEMTGRVVRFHEEFEGKKLSGLYALGARGCRSWSRGDGREGEGKGKP